MTTRIRCLDGQIHELENAQVERIFRELKYRNLMLRCWWYHKDDPDGINYGITGGGWFARSSGDILRTQSLNADEILGIVALTDSDGIILVRAKKYAG